MKIRNNKISRSLKVRSLSLAGLFCCLMLITLLTSACSEEKYSEEELKIQVEEAVSKALEDYDEMQSEVREGAEEVKENFSEGLSEAAEEVSEAIGEAGEDIDEFIAEEIESKTGQTMPENFNSNNKEEDYADYLENRADNDLLQGMYELNKEFYDLELEVAQSVPLIPGKLYTLMAKKVDNPKKDILIYKGIGGNFYISQKLIDGKLDMNARDARLKQSDALWKLIDNLEPDHRRAMDIVAETRGKACELRLLRFELDADNDFDDDYDEDDEDDIYFEDDEFCAEEILKKGKGLHAKYVIIAAEENGDRTLYIIDWPSGKILKEKKIR